MITLYCRYLLIALALLLVAGCGEPPNISVTRESAAELYPVTLDSAYLKRLEAWTAQAARDRLNETYERNEVPHSARTSQPYLRSHYLDTDAGRLAVVELAYSGSPVRVTRISGLVDGELFTVSCTSPDGAPYELFDGKDECGERVHRVFLR